MRALCSLAPQDHGFAAVEDVAVRAGLDAVVLGVDAAQHDAVTAAAAASDLGTVVNLPLMLDPAYLRENPASLATTSRGRPAVEEWLWYACPSDERWWQHRLGTLRAGLERFRPVTVSLDFARGFVFWERVPPPGEVDPAAIEHGCCCGTCRPAHLDARAAEEARVELVTRRVGEAAALVREVHPGVPVGVKLVPWLGSDYDGARRRVAGQDPARLAEHVDVLMPMSYSHLVGRPASYLRELHRELVELTGKPLVPWLQADIPDRPEGIPFAELDAMLTVFENDGIENYCIFQHSSVAVRPDIISRLRGRRSA